MHKILYKKENESLFKEYWENFINDFDFLSYRYLYTHMEYALFYARNLISNESFVYIENNKCVGIAFVPIEEKDGIHQISISFGQTMAPIAINERIEKIIFKELDKIIEINNIRKASFFIDQVYSSKFPFNYLLKYGFVDCSTTNGIVYLDETKEKLWSNLNKSYKPLINSINKNEDFEVLIFDKNNADYDTHEYYRELHALCSGGPTRDKKTFDKQFELLENDNACLIGLKYKDAFIGFNYFFHFKEYVIYASGADDPSYEKEKLPIYHVILNAAINYYKDLDYKFIEFSQPCGYNDINGFGDYLDIKQRNISSFKRGMGASMCMFFRGNKYLDVNLFIEDIEEFKNKVENINV